MRIGTIRVRSSLSFALLALTACASLPAPEAARVADAPHPRSSPAPVAIPVHWSYEGDAGPERWSDLSPAYAACRSVGRQSPIAIERAEVAEAEGIRFDYRTSRLRLAHHEHVTDLVDNGHTLQVTVDEGSRLETPRERYALLQFHFHTPSEHVVDGRRFPMEIHFVHQARSGRFAVVAALVEEGPESRPLAQLISHLPSARGEVVHRPDVSIEPGAHLAAQSGVIAYLGSFTTPPCTEDVEWLLLERPLPASRAQLEVFAERLGANARPLQARGDRIVRRQRFAGQLE